MADIRYDEDKLKDLILYIAFKSNDDSYFGKTKLNKILFFSDFLYYRHYGKAITGAKYIKNKYGPTVKHLDTTLRDLKTAYKAVMQNFIVFGYDQKKLIAIDKVDLSRFDAQEISFVDQIISELRGDTANRVSKLSHEFAAWKILDFGDEIPYSLALVLNPQKTKQLLSEKDIAIGKMLDEKYKANDLESVNKI